MKYRYKHYLMFFSLFVICSFADAQQSQIKETKKTAKVYIKAETIKAIESKLIEGLEAERNSKVVSNAIKKFWESTKSLNAQQIEMLAEHYTNVSKTNLKKLADLSPSQLNCYAHDIFGRIKIDTNTLKQIIYREGDKAGTATLKTLAEIDNAFAKTGEVSTKLLAKLKSEASGLHPKQARAFYDLLKAKVSNDWADIKNIDKAAEGIGRYVGTFVDGVFVLNDTYDIYYSNEAPDIKAIKATSKIIDYGTTTGSAAGATALGGGLGAGLVIAFTANRVSTLYTEVSMLQKEREIARNAEQNEKLYNGILVRRQLVNISSKIKSGDLAKAEFLLVKLEQFLYKHNVDNFEKLIELHKELKQKAKNAERKQQVNQVINKARYPYRDAFDLYQRGVELNWAKKHASRSLEILRENLKKYPEIKQHTAIQAVRNLIHAIETKISEAPDLAVAEVDCPEEVYSGQSVDINILVKGGIPYYRAVGAVPGNISDGMVTLFWEAPAEAGKNRVTFKISDCMGATASISKTIQIVGHNEIIEQQKTVKENTEFYYGTWQIKVRPQGSVDGDIEFVTSEEEAVSSIEKSVSYFERNPVFAKNTSNFSDFADIEFLPQERFSYKKQGPLFIIKAAEQDYQLNFAVQLINEKNLRGKMFAFSKNSQGYVINKQDIIGTKIK